MGWGGGRRLIMTFCPEKAFLGYTTASLEFQEPRPRFMTDMAQVEMRSLITNAQLVVSLCNGRVAMACVLPSNSGDGMVRPARIVFMDVTNGQMIGHMVVDPDLICKICKAVSAQLSYETWAVTVTFSESHDPIIFEINVKDNVVESYEIVGEVKDTGIPARAANCSIAGVFDAGVYVHAWPTTSDGTRWGMLTRSNKNDVESTKVVEVMASVGAVLYASATHVLAICDGLPVVINRESGKVRSTPMWAPKGERLDAIVGVRATWNINGEDGVIALVLEAGERKFIATTTVHKRALDRLQWMCTMLVGSDGRVPQSKVTIPAINANGMIAMYFEDAVHIGIYHAEQHISEPNPDCPGYLVVRLLIPNTIPGSPFVALVDASQGIRIAPEDMLDPMENQEMFTRVKGRGETGKTLNIGLLVRGINDARNERDEQAKMAKIGEEMTAGLIAGLEKDLKSSQEEVQNHREVIDAMSAAQKTMVNQIKDLTEKASAHKALEKEAKKMREDLTKIKADLEKAQSQDQEALLRALMDDGGSGGPKGKRAKSAPAAASSSKQDKVVAKQDKVVAKMAKERDEAAKAQEEAIRARDKAIMARDTEIEARRSIVIEMSKKIDQMRSEIKRAEEAAKVAKQARAALDTRLSETRVIIKTLRDRVAELESTAQSRVAELESTVQSRVAELESTAQARVAELESTAQAQAAELIELRESKAILEGSLQSAAGELDAEKKGSVDLERRIVNLEAELAQVCAGVMSATGAPNVFAGIHAFSQMGYDLVAARRQITAFHMQFGIPYATEVWVPYQQSASSMNMEGAPPVSGGFKDGVAATVTSNAGGISAT